MNWTRIKSRAKAVHSMNTSSEFMQAQQKACIDTFLQQIREEATHSMFLIRKQNIQRVEDLIKEYGFES